MNLFAFIAALNAIAATFIGFFVYSQNRQGLVNKTFGAFCVLVVWWSAGYFFWQISDTSKEALFWSRVLMMGAIFIPIANFHFILAFLKKIIEQRKVLWFGYVVFTLFALSNFTSYFAQDVAPRGDFSFWPTPGVLFHPFLFLWFAYLGYGMFLLLKDRAQAVGQKTNQIDYILVATIIGYGGGITNFFLWYNIPIPPFGNWGPLLYVGVVAYAMLKQNLFGVRLLLTQFLVGVIAILLFVDLFASQTPFEYFWKGALLGMFLVLGYLLVKSVLVEIRQKEQLQEAYRKLEQLDKTKSEFVSIASHQLRTPLTAMKGYLSMLLEGSYGPLALKQNKPIESVYESSERLIRLVNDLLNVSRIESGKIEMKLEQGSVEEIIKSVIKELVIKTKEKDVKLIFEEPESSLPLIRIDKEKIRNVVLNIVDNAIRYTPHGKVILSVVLRQQNVLLRIQDTGEGMTQEEIGKLFETFSRGGAGMKFSTEGAGLGLYIAKKFVEMHKGRIWAESEGKGKGSTFYVELPVKQEI